MNKEDIVRMAQESGFSVGVTDPVIYAAHERFFHAAYAAGVAAERERLAQPQRTHWEGCEEVHPECRQQKQEPTVKHMMEWVEYLKRQSDHGQHLHIPSGMSAGTCWELAIELEQFISTTPQQRQWQGLNLFDKTLLRTTHAPMKPVYYDRVNDHSVCAEVVTDWDNFFAAIEAKLKEKNT